MTRATVGLLIAVGLVAIPMFVFAADTVQNTQLTALQEAVSSLYSYSLKIVGLVVFVMIVIAGLVKITGMKTPFGDTETIIKNAVIGMILLFSAYLILNTINPALVGNTSSSQSAPATAQSLTTAPVRTPLPADAVIVFPPQAGDTGYLGAYIIDGILYNDAPRLLIVLINGEPYGTVRAGARLTLSGLPPGTVTYSL